MRLSKDTLRAIATHELVGLEVEVSKATHRRLEGLRGRVVDETLNVIVVETRAGEKRLPKRAVTLVIHFPDKPREVDGKDLLQRPEERLKKLWRKIR